jgi:hypothetical protein
MVGKGLAATLLLIAALAGPSPAADCARQCRRRRKRQVQETVEFDGATVPARAPLRRALRHREKNSTVLAGLHGVAACNAG